MGLADLHIHTVYSWDGLATVSSVLEYASSQTELDVIAITDHDNITGALYAQDMAPKYGIEVIPGCEISTEDGHLIGLFIEEPIPSRRPLVETILRVGEMGGICIVPHPLVRSSQGLSAEAIYKALLHEDVAKVLLGLEAVNASVLYFNAQAPIDELFEVTGLAQVGSSDAHVEWMVGHAATAFQGDSAKDLRAALKAGATQVQASSEKRLFEFYLSHANRYILRHIGLKPVPAAAA